MQKANKRNLITILVILEILIILLCFNTYLNKHKYKITNEVRFKEQQIDKSTFALLIEQNGSYVESNQSTWPTLPDYKFNGELSGCIDLNGEAVEDVLSFNDGVMSLTTNKSVKCYVYFGQTYKVSINGETLGFLPDELVDLSEYTSKIVSITNNVDGTTLNPNVNSVTLTYSGFTANNLSDNADYGVTTNLLEEWDGSLVNATFFKNLGDKGSTVTINGSYNSVTLPTVTKTGYNCGYTTSSTETSIEYQGGTTYSGNSNGLYVYCKKKITFQSVIEDNFISAAEGATTSASWAVVNEDGYRYEGTNPDNYLIMCPSNEPNCSCTLPIADTKWASTNTGCEYAWRIIGMFPDGTDGSNVIRIVKNKWDTQKYNNDTSTNYWPNSTLYSTWNNIYTKTNYPATVDFKAYLGTSSSYDSYKSADLYKMERGLESKGSKGPASGATINANVRVGLIYPSDYGYGVLANACVRTKEPYNYDGQASCYNNNWLFQGSSKAQWLVSPDADSAAGAFRVSTYGYVDNYDDNVPNSYAARPVLSLEASLEISGDGTPGNPYKLVG